MFHLSSIQIHVFINENVLEYDIFNFGIIMFLEKLI